MSSRALTCTCIFWLVVLCTDAFFLPFSKNKPAETSPKVRTNQRNRNRGRFYGLPRRLTSAIKQKYRKLSRYFARQSLKPHVMSDRAFIDYMFSMFDINGDEIIEHKEFGATLKGMGILRHRL